MQQVHAKKFLGQHFLTDLTVARNIAETAYKGQSDEVQSTKEKIRVLEIGPGMGVLTQFLLKDPNIQLTAIEIDRGISQRMVSGVASDTGRFSEIRPQYHLSRW